MSMDNNSIIHVPFAYVGNSVYQLSNIFWNKDLRDTGLFVIQFLGLIFLAIYVWKTWQMASSTKDSVKTSEKMIEEMKEERDQESAPYVVPYINISQHMMSFGIKNIGKTVAKNIRINIEPGLKSSILGEKIKDLPLFKTGISSLPPGHEIGTIFDVSHVYLNRDDFPMSYSVKITYIGGLQKEPREHEQVLDLSVYKDLIPDEEKKLDDVVKELENLSKYNGKISENLKSIDENLTEGIWLKNPDPILFGTQLDFVSWKSIAISKLRELKVLLSWLPEERTYSFSRYIKIRIAALIGQILVISSNYPSDINFEVSKGLESLALDMFEFSRSISFSFGRGQEGFSKEVHKYISVIDDLIEKISS